MQPTSPDPQQVKSELTDLVRSADALTAMLISREGTDIAHAGNTSFLNVTAMAALVAGMFSATREVARMVGENQFSILLQQGERRHIHISLVSGTAMLVVVFEDYQRIGRVRHEARKSAERLADILAQQETQEELRSQISTPRFKEYALNLIDSIFTPPE